MKLVKKFSFLPLFLIDSQISKIKASHAWHARGNRHNIRKLQNEDEIRELINNFTPDTTTATSAYLETPPLVGQNSQENGIIYKTKRNYRNFNDYSSDEDIDSTHRLTYDSESKVFTIPRGIYRPPEYEDSTLRTTKHEIEKLDWNDLQVIESNLEKTPTIISQNKNHKKGQKGRFYDDRDTSHDNIPEITYESDGIYENDSNTTDLQLRKGSSNKQKLKFNDWRAVNPDDFNNICGWLPNLWKVQMGNYRVDFFQGNKRKETIIARISPNTCDEFKAKPKTNQYFYPKRRNYGFAVCQKKLGKWKKKKNIKSVCTDSKVSWANSKPPKGVMRRYTSEDFE